MSVDNTGYVQDYPRSFRTVPRPLSGPPARSSERSIRGRLGRIVARQSRTSQSRPRGALAITDGGGCGAGGGGPAAASWRRPRRCRAPRAARARRTPRPAPPACVWRWPFPRRAFSSTSCACSGTTPVDEQVY